MSKFVAVLQLLTALVLGITSLATLVNLLFISTRPETISVVNAIIGQGVLIICLLVITRILLRKGLFTLRNPKTDSETESAPD